MNESNNFLLQKNLASTNLAILEKEIENSNITCEKLLTNLEQETQEKENLEREINCLLETVKERDREKSIQEIGKLEEEFLRLKEEKEVLKKEYNEYEDGLQYMMGKKEELEALEKEIEFRKNVIYNLNEEIIKETQQCSELQSQDRDSEMKNKLLAKKHQGILNKFEEESKNKRF
jgi:predicted RNase H-like nuclease (RuvC/YqgF family)